MWKNKGYKIKFIIWYKILKTFKNKTYKKDCKRISLQILIWN